MLARRRLATGSPGSQPTRSDNRIGALGPRCRAVDSFDAARDAAFVDGVNAVCFARAHAGCDFDAVLAAALAADDSDDDLVDVDVDALAAADLAPAATRAVAVLRDDVARLAALGKDPIVNAIRRYPRDTRGLPIAVDVHSFHADRAPVCTETWLCTYAGAPSEGVDNDAAVRLVDDDDVRAALRAHAGALDDDGFAAFLADGSFDLHHRVVDDSGVFSFGVGALWKLAVHWPGAAVPPCLHRAPLTSSPRLLLIC